ncbi:hypothetical protein RchiOBHm_Chr0c32g0501611 [Rosa chinensis]|uniref:Uncharacterized protein n=1 Tax=Rosa chinensis TaxID=74649 RepID=A0A2P6SQA6_ROSCH|nr:hypothetical protein RchiOBHm_Chr1g0332751 [Rosa chinensis]PRQ60852.1 hypothetical protein RchiOBHm_Chr0c32g0501611 [Rosa chinensis]
MRIRKSILIYTLFIFEPEMSLACGVTSLFIGFRFFEISGEIIQIYWLLTIFFLTIRGSCE